MDTNAVVRQDPKTMTDREIAEESLVYLRAFADALSAVASNPFMGAMVPPSVRDSITVGS